MVYQTTGNSMMACEQTCIPNPVLRERLESALKLIDSANCIANGIDNKLFSPRAENPSIEGPEPGGNDLETLIERINRLADRLESHLSYIDGNL